jgi:hypothetical protein
MAQTVPVIAGRIYLGTAWVDATAAGNRASLQLVNGSVLPSAGTQPSDSRSGLNGAQFFATTLAPSGTNAVITVRSRENVSGPLRVDDIQVREVILPA